MRSMQCAPATHKYKSFGKVLYCEKCADVQPLLLSEPDLPTQNLSAVSNSPPPLRESSEPSVGEIEAHIQRLRNTVGLGQRTPYEGDFEDEIPPAPRVRVDEGFDGDKYNDSIPGAGL